MSVLLYDPEAAAITVVRFDAVVTVTHSRKSRVTRHPVELGGDVTDHSQSEPHVVQLSDAIISNFPALLAAPLWRSSSYAHNAYQQLETWRDWGIPINCATEADFYENMLIEELELPQDAARCNSLHMQIKLVKVAMVETETTQAPKAKRDSAATQKNKGTKTKTTQVDNGSVLGTAAGDSVSSALPRPPGL